MISALLAVVAGAAGLFCLFSSQSRQGNTRRLQVFFGWSLLLLSAVFWVQTSGMEYGLVYGLICPALFAWLLIWFVSSQSYKNNKSVTGKNTKDKRNTADRAPGMARAEPISVQGVALNLAYFLFTVPVLAIFSTVISVSASYLIPVSELNQLALSIVLQPLLWGILAVWFFMDPHRLRPPLIALVFAIASAAYLFL